MDSNGRNHLANNRMPSIGEVPADVLFAQLQKSKSLNISSRKHSSGNPVLQTAVDRINAPQPMALGIAKQPSKDTAKIDLQIDKFAA